VIAALRVFFFLHQPGARRSRQDEASCSTSDPVSDISISGVAAGPTVVRKLIESTLVSVDGVIGDPQVWAEPYFDDEAGKRALKQLLVSDAMLMGRRTYEMFAAMWPASTGAYADSMNTIRKYVFSSTLQTAEWSNSTIISGDVPAAVSELKQQNGQDLVMYGHGSLGQTLLEHRLLDELRLWVHPLIVGRGATLFREGANATLKLVATETLETGVVMLIYKPSLA
jgi:dihydrofolate reductase